MDFSIIHNWSQIIMLAAGSILMLVWLFFALRYVRDFDDLIRELDSSEYLFPSMYYIGFGVLDAIGFDVTKHGNPKAIAKFTEIGGNKYAYYYYYVSLGGKIAYLFTFTPIGLLIAALANQVLFAPIGAIVAIMLVIDFDSELQKKVENRRSEILMELPQALSKLALLVRAGLPLRSAWARVADTGEGLLYYEMKVTMQEIQKGGVTEEEAYRNFAVRCEVKEIKKFSSMIIQNLKKGNEELAYYLKQMSNEMWENKKQLIQRKGENAKSLLMLPTVLIFIGILIIIMVPIFQSFQNMGM